MLAVTYVNMLVLYRYVIESLKKKSTKNFKKKLRGNKLRVLIEKRNLLGNF